MIAALDELWWRPSGMSGNQVREPVEMQHERSIAWRVRFEARDCVCQHAAGLQPVVPLNYVVVLALQAACL